MIVFVIGDSVLKLEVVLKTSTFSKESQWNINLVWLVIKNSLYQMSFENIFKDIYLNWEISPKVFKKPDNNETRVSIFTQVSIYPFGH